MMFGLNTINNEVVNSTMNKYNMMFGLNTINNKASISKWPITT